MKKEVEAETDIYIEKRKERGGGREKKGNEKGR